MASLMMNLSAPMDFEGQRKAERLIHIIITTCGCVGLVFGWFQQEYSKCVYTIFAGIVPPNPPHTTTTVRANDSGRPKCTLEKDIDSCTSCER